MLTKTICVVLFVFGSVHDSSSFDLCSFSSGNVSDTDDSYNWKNKTDQNCGCINCIRKCCKPGYIKVLGSPLCVWNASKYSFKVPVYKNKFDFVEDAEDFRRFVVGPIRCEYLNLKYPLEQFYVQIDGNVWVPIYERYFNNKHYCVDENDGFTPLLCLPPENRIQIKFNIVGMSSSSFKYVDNFGFIVLIDLFSLCELILSQ